MDFKKEIETLLEILEKKGFSREEIEIGVNRSPNWIDQSLARGGNEKAYGLIKLFNDSNIAKRNAPEAIEEREGGDPLYLLKLSLKANIDHASANKENAEANKQHASAHDKNADSMKELIKLLGIKINSGSSKQVSRLSKGAAVKRHGPSARMKGSLDKQEIHSGPKKKGKKKDIS